MSPLALLMPTSNQLQIIYLFLISVVSACGAPETSELVFQEYTFQRMMPEDVSMPSGLTLVLGAANYELFSDDGVISEGVLRLEEEDNWLQGCAGMGAAAPLQTAVLKGEFTLGPHLLLNPWVAPDCFDSDTVYVSVGKDEKTGPCVGLSCVVFEKKRD